MNRFRHTLTALSLFVCLGSSLGSSARADTLAANFTGFTASVVNEPNTAGWTFSTNGAITVTALGLYDLGQDGLVASHLVGIFNEVGVLLVSTTVSPSDPLQGAFRFAPITPLELPSGRIFTIGALVGQDDHVIGGAVGFSADPAINFIGGRYTFGPTLSFPTSDPGANPSIFGPNFLLVPEPSTFAMLGLGILAVGGYGRHSATNRKCRLLRARHSL